VRKFASGFHHQFQQDPVHDVQQKSSNTISVQEQETLVHFHAHQIQRLVGPNAIIGQLQRSASVLSTAIVLFRRFYLSNSIIDFHPRDIAAASALLAAKVDHQRMLDVSPQKIFWKIFL
jgi:cyclin H